MSVSPATCGILFPRAIGGVRDEVGCCLSERHQGPHQFVHDGRPTAWENDDDCDCEYCRSEDPCDWCVVYWEVTPATQA